MSTLAQHFFVILYFITLFNNLGSIMGGTSNIFIEDSPAPKSRQDSIRLSLELEFGRFASLLVLLWTTESCTLEKIEFEFTNYLDSYRTFEMWEK